MEVIRLMSSKSQPKRKISEVAKDLGITSQELIDFVEKNFNEVKKPSASVEAEQLNIILEYYTQQNQVETFDGYFAKRNEPRPKKKPAAKKKAEPKAEKTDEKTEVKAVKTEKPEKKTVAAKETKAAREAKAVKADEKPAAKTENKPAEQPKSAAQTKTEDRSADPKKNEQRKDRSERFNAQQALKSGENNKNKKPERKPERENRNQNRNKLDIKFSDASSSTVDQKLHKVDTRGSYVEIDKYNEKYENIAPVQGGKHKDNFSKKQKLTQKSQQRKQQQYSNKRETEAEKLRRLELERARKQQLKVHIPDEIVVSELASRLKVTA